MGIGTSLFLTAVGAILYFAVNATVQGLSISTIGLILMIVGIVGLLISLFYTTLWTRPRREVEPPPPDATRRPVARDREYYQ
jgi:membrane protein implicated in regulation of membrane protease activity